MSGTSWLKPASHERWRRSGLGPDDEVVLEGEWIERPELAEGQPRLRQVQGRTFSGSCTCSAAQGRSEGSESISMKVESYDKLVEGAHDLAADSPHVELVESVDTIDGFRAFFAGSFRWCATKKGALRQCARGNGHMGSPATTSDNRRRRTRRRFWR